MTCELKTLFGSATKTASFDTKAAPMNVGLFSEATFVLSITAASGTSPTLDVQIVRREPGCNVWKPLAVFAQQTSTGSVEIDVPSCLGYEIALDVTIGGTDPSFTFAVSAVLKSPS